MFNWLKKRCRKKHVSVMGRGDTYKAACEQALERIRSFTK